MPAYLGDDVVPPLDEEAVAALPKKEKPVQDPRRDWGMKWLYAFSQTGTFLEACKRAHVNRRVVNRRIQSEPEFEKLYKEAYQDFVDSVEQVAIDRAKRGNDKMLELMLKSHKPETYDRTKSTNLNIKAETTSEVTHSGSVQYTGDQISEIINILNSAGALGTGTDQTTPGTADT